LNALTRGLLGLLLIALTLCGSGSSGSCGQIVVATDVCKALMS